MNFFPNNSISDDYVDVYKLTSRTQFHLNTCGILIKSFGKTVPGKVNTREYDALMKCIEKWRMAFRRYDTDNSGTISLNELCRILKDAKYRISQQTVRDLLIFTKKQQTSENSRYSIYNNTEELELGHLIYLTFYLEKLADYFKKHDIRMNGVATYQFENYIQDVSNIIYFSNAL
ncbi:hypothetical protein A3Q56_04845 [Intoshia linei]|uniref:EF-hand domain-containing protein n=1 Tax=Intoshia linei TaxID=1819745 RepID=A0A177B1D5_9BILA|nr:hypothetical protein A3Q56_04845 [Intoshia linei]